MILEFLSSFLRTMGGIAIAIAILGFVGTSNGDDPDPLPAEYCPENTAGDDCKRAGQACNSGHGPSTCTWEPTNYWCCCPYDSGGPSKCDD